MAQQDQNQMQVPQHHPQLPDEEGNDLSAVGDMFPWYQQDDSLSHEASLAASPAAMPTDQSLAGLTSVDAAHMHSMASLQANADACSASFPTSSFAYPFELSPDGHRLANHIIQYHNPENTQDHRRPCIADNPSVVFNECSLPRIEPDIDMSDAAHFFENLNYNCGYQVQDPMAFARHVFQEHAPALMLQDPYAAGFSNAFQNHLASFIPAVPQLPEPAFDFRTLPETGRCHSIPASTATDFSFQHSFPGTPLRTGSPRPGSPSEIDCNCPESDCPPEPPLDLVKKERKASQATATSSTSEAMGTFTCHWRWEHDGSPCKKSFPTALALHEHCKESHTRLALKEKDTTYYLCKWNGCERKGGFSQRAKLERHLQTHTGYKPSLCTICGLSFSARQALEQHMRTHTGATPWACDWPGCGKLFKQQSAYTMHRRTHTGEKPLKCDICGKTFSESSNLSKHRRTHNDKGLHNCELCNRDFHRRDQLRRHLKSTHKDRMDEVEKILARPAGKPTSMVGRGGIVKHQHGRTPSLSMSRAESSSQSPDLQLTPPDTVLQDLKPDDETFDLNDMWPPTMMPGDNTLDNLL